MTNLSPAAQAAPDFRALCAELIENLEIHCEVDVYSLKLIDRARAALATPPPEPGKSIEELIAGCKPLDLAMAEMLTPDARWRLFGEDDSLPPPPEPPTDEELRQLWLNLYATNDGPTSGEVVVIARAALERWGK
jgi:hypothetical protein